MTRALTITAVGLALVLGSAASASAQGADGYDDWNGELIGFPSNTRDSPRANCAAGRGECIERTLGEMWRRFHREIGVCEHHNVFSLTYIRVTEDVRDAIAEGMYPDERWINRLDAMFARTYFLGFDNWRQGRRELVPPAWRIAFETARDERVEGIGNLLLSMNAHINRDFPFVLYHAGLTHPDGRSRKPEHDAFNAKLRARYAPVLEELADRFDPSIASYNVPFTELDEELIFQILVFWREMAWQYAVRLTDAGSDGARRAIGAEIEQYAVLQAQLMLALFGYLPGQGTEARDARCAAHGGQRPDWRRGADVARPLPRGLRVRGSRLLVPLSCPDGIGPCRGMLRARMPGAGGPGSRARLLGRGEFSVAAGERARVGIRIGAANARRLRAAGSRRAWLVARSRLGPGDGASRRVRVRPRGG